jgi:tRNA dimethylallyltransferase
LRWLIIAGPTASGKSSLALELAGRFEGEIINADSRQVYRHLDIGTAKPSAEDRRRIPHHLFDVADPSERFDAARYRDLARAVVREVASRGKLPIVVGGTGLYIRALARGLFAAPPARTALRTVLARLEERVPGTLLRWNRRLDSSLVERVHANDRVRLIRALEVTLSTGEAMSAQQRRHGFGDPYGEFLYLVIDPGAQALKQLIRQRSVQLFACGLVDEVRSLWARGYGPELPAMRSIGYREVGRMLAGELDGEQALEALVCATERFAKRQRTWFRAEAGAAWIDPRGGEDVLVDRVRHFLAGRPSAL